MPLFLLPLLSGAKSAFDGLLAFFSKPPGIYIGAALAALLAIWLYGRHEYNLGKADCKAEVITKIQKQVEYQDRVTTQVITKYVKVQAADTAHMQTVIEEVHSHVTPQVDVDYAVPCGFGRVFNDAWHGPVPDPAACPDASPSDTPLSAVAQAEAVNGGQYDQVSHQLIALQDWVRQQQGAPK